jgi:O-antigen biosynthesis protein
MLFRYLKRYYRQLRNISESNKQSLKFSTRIDQIGEASRTLSENSIGCKKKSYRIAFIIPGMREFSGGHTTILRVGTFLSTFGHQVSYITFDKSDVKSMEKIAKINLEHYQGVIRSSEALNEKYDIGICTLWISCFHLLKYEKNFEYKMYFVQDYEPYFYEMGDEYLLSTKTYDLGFHIISLGAWNMNKIFQYSIDKTKIKYNIIDFPFDPVKYSIVERNISITDEIRIAVYMRFDARRAPYVLLSQLTYLAQHLRGIKLTINIFGINKRVKLPVGHNLGQLSKDDLIRLYKQSHFGIVASLTNISLVNYEMIACGLPVLDFIEGSAPVFFNCKEMIFIDSATDSMEKKIAYYMKNQVELIEIIRNGQKKIRELSWEKSSKQFADAISSL